MTNPIPAPIPNPQPPTPKATGPRTAAGKQRSSQNALTHGLTAASPVLPSEDRAAYEDHRRGFFDEYKPATATESQLVQEMADTSWRLNRIPLLEAALLDRAANPPSEQARIDFDIVDAHRALAILGLHYTRLSCQFQKSLDKLGEIQSDCPERERHDLKEAAASWNSINTKDFPGSPPSFFSDDGFVFSKDLVEAFAQRLIAFNQSRHIEHVRFYMQPPAHAAGV
jgi:hypothetical protein